LCDLVNEDILDIIYALSESHVIRIFHLDDCGKYVEVFLFIAPVYQTSRRSPRRTLEKAV